MDRGGIVRESKTTTVGIRLKDYVILAADKRATAGTYVAHKRVTKIHRISDKMSMTISGLVADAQYLVSLARAVVDYYTLETGIRPSVKAVASYLASILSSYSKLSPFIVQLLLAGYDTEPRLYYIDLFGTVSEEKYMATGSGSPVAIGVLEHHYQEGMGLDEAKELAVSAVKAAVERDSWSGEGVDVVVIGRDTYSFETILFKPKQVISEIR